ncbi:trans-aconitate 2-methyltransferase [Dickeya zeae]|uniref:Trans-aconitate 2-methyltransferase n=1 Tax=Dickeya zeae TaxID=204042 RepID=A0AAE6Z1M3_9GAMM|nr:trans-aconitate 2-methyltransferase [Dickeya zeae]MCO7262761.1 trans-aconitate 2-methyltransferase [Dickeya zeae]QIZ52576.1 trans-aconitate 2-methyltransferase [Dickeya zeae]
MQDWNPELYLRFANERTRPALELLSRISHPHPTSVTDLGCGPGNSTELLHQAWPQAQVTGVDNSAAMLQQAQQRLPGCAFQQADIADWQPDTPQDVIYANASLQWLSDHERLLSTLVARLAPGGVLAVQMPDTLSQPTHQLMRSVAAAGPWKDRFGDIDQIRHSLLSPAQYYNVLVSHGCDVDIWQTTYYHIMGGAQAIIEWLKGTGLRPFLAPLNAQEQQDFLQRYQSCLQAAYPTQADGNSLLIYPRLFMVATRRR